MLLRARSGRRARSCSLARTSPNGDDDRSRSRPAHSIVARCGYAADLEAASDAFNAIAAAHRLPVVNTPRYYAVDVRPGFTQTHGGIRIHSDGRVLAADGTPMTGLLAAGADAGGMFDQGYGRGCQRLASWP